MRARTCFAAGAVFYHLLARRKPFEAKRLPQVLNNVMKEQPAALTDAEAPAELFAIVMKALEKDPARRYQHMIEMLTSLTRFKQAWDRQTRDLATQAYVRYEANARLIAERRARGDADEEVAAAPLLRELPLFEERGAEVLKVVPLRRDRVVEIARVLEDQRTRLEAERS